MKTGRIREIACLVLAIALVGMTVACGGGGAGAVESNLTGSPEEVLNQLLEDIVNSGAEMPMALPPLAVDPEMSQNAIGLPTAVFGSLVADASYSLAAIGTFAHQIIVIQAVDAASAVQIKSLVSGDGGYDPMKWICVWPEKVATVDSGVYVLIVASYNNVVDAALAAFEAEAGNVGEVVTFWDFADHGGDLGGIEGGFGGLEPLPIG